MKLVAALLVGAALGCSGHGAVNPLGTGGSNGGGGNGGTGGAGGSAGDPGFVSVAPCLTESSYVAGVASISFGGGLGDTYSPACLKVQAGAQVTFAGDFGNHPLAPSAARGTLTGNPITVTSVGSNAAFTFPNPGFWAYYCMVHGGDPDGQDMAGVVWVQ